MRTAMINEDDLTEQQGEALDDVVEWFERGDSQVFRLFGYAGTGKTTLARRIANELGVPVEYAAFTGKASHVLRSKGCNGARTLHSLIYIPAQPLRDELSDLYSELRSETDKATRAELLMDIRALERQLDDPGWILNENSDLRDASLLIVDEVSMVDEEMARDILSFNVPVLVLGDPAQLPPVKGRGFFINAKPDYMLTEIHRQEGDSVIVELATGIRSGRRFIKQRLGTSSIYLPVTKYRAKKFDQLIVGTNRTRWRRIHQLRRMHGLTDDLPMVGDKVICLANNPDFDIFNGQMFTVLDAEANHDESVIEMKVRDDDGKTRTLSTWAVGFRGERAEKDFKPIAHYRRSNAFMTFGWAISCHKAQGSQWGSVLIVDESAWFRQDRHKWLYTAVTRAESRVSLIGAA